MHENINEVQKITVVRQKVFQRPFRGLLEAFKQSFRALLGAF
jgi:hypothetical protein